MAALDIHMLNRAEADADWHEHVRTQARIWFDACSGSDRDELKVAVMAGLSGTTAESRIRSAARIQFEHLLECEVASD